MGNRFFQEPQNICYIVGAYESGEIGIDLKENNLIICADGGFEILKKYGVSPHVIVGDFDSLGYVPTGDNVKVYPTEKDDSDTGIAIKYGFEQGYKNFVIYGGLGGRFDHTLANIQLLSFIAEKGGMGWLVGDGSHITVIKDREISIRGEGFISVLSLSDKSEGVTLRDLKYPLENATLSNNFPLGLSNEFINGETAASIRVQSGMLLVVVNQ